MSTVEWNGGEYNEESFATAARFVANSLSPAGVSRIDTREDFFDRLGRQFDGDRDIYDVLGYPDDIELEDYRAKYERDVGRRIVRLPAEDSWQKNPEIIDVEESETTFEEEIERHVQSVHPWHYMRRTDIVAGIGQFGVLFIGFTDNADLEEPVDEGSLPTDETEAVSHFQPFAHDSVENWKLGKDEGLEPEHERYNKPVQYNVDFGDPENQDDTDTEWVHWNRIIHVPSDERDESDLKGNPRLKSVFNRLIDLEKTVGASAENFWTGASPRYQFNVDADDASDIPEDELEALDGEVQKLVHDMQNYIKTFNTDLEVISGEEVDPSGVVDVIYQSISATKGIPKRILTGSERGELASSQDRANWFGTVENRQNQFLEKTCVREYIDRLREYDVLSEPEGGVYDVFWPNLFELNEVEKSEVEANRSEVLANLAPKGNTDLLGDYSELMEYVKTGDKPSFEAPSEPALPEGDEQVQEQFGG